MMHNHNPFIYDGPVPAERFINRQSELKRLFARLRNGGNSIIIGIPNVGKTSLLHSIISRFEWYKYWAEQEMEHFILVEVDFGQEGLNVTSSQELWQMVLDKIKLAVGHKTSEQDIIGLDLKETKYVSKLKCIFEQLDKYGWRVALLIDQFEAFLDPLNPGLDPFLRELRQIATMSKSLQYIIASTTSIGDIYSYLPGPSPILNYLFEEYLGPFSEDNTTQLLDEAISQSKSHVQFDTDDRTFITWLSGGYPYLVQVAGASLFDALKADKQNEQRYATAGEFFCQRTGNYFDKLWQSFLKKDQKGQVMVSLGIMELGGLLQEFEFPAFQIEEMQIFVRNFSQELSDLEKLGLLQKVGQNWRYYEDKHLLLPGKDEQLGTQAGFVWWLAGVLAGNRSDTIDIAQWLHDRAEWEDDPFTREQWQVVLDWHNQVAPRKDINVSELIQQFTAGFSRYQSR